MNRTTRLASSSFARPLLLALFAALAVTACGNDADPDKPGRQVKSRAGEGREETKGIRNTENIGYSGNAIGAKIDEAIVTNENHPAELQRQIDQQTE